MKESHLISADELRAAGALDVPAAWRNSLDVERDLFSGLIDEEISNTGDQEPSQGDMDDDGAESDPRQPAMIPSYAAKNSDVSSPEPARTGDRPADPRPADTRRVAG